MLNYDLITRYLHENATKMQKIWRGFSGRRIYRDHLSVSYHKIDLKVTFILNEFKFKRLKLEQ